MDTMTGLQATIDLAVKSPEDFTIRLSEVWEEVGYSSKQMCEKGMKAYLEEGSDWVSEGSIPRLTLGGKQNISEYLLTGDGFRDLCLSANTENGRELRRYYIRVEKEYRKLLTASLSRTPIDNTALYQQLGAQSQEISQLMAQVKALQSDRENLRAVSGNLYAERPDSTTLIYNLAQVRAIVGYKDESYAWKVIRECMIEGRDYKVLNSVEGQEDLLMTDAALQELAIVARSGRGCRSGYLPDLLVVEKSRLMPVGTGRSNTRHGQSFA
jgi:phage anti-repressor protein